MDAAVLQMTDSIMAGTPKAPVSAEVRRRDARTIAVVVATCLIVLLCVVALVAFSPQVRW
jgi:hypothetical protein